MPGATFYFDLGSPFAYLTAERIREHLPEPVVWQPVLLGGIFRLNGRSSWALSGVEQRRAGIAEVEWRSLPQETRDLITCYAAGVNAVIDQSRDAPPIEFAEKCPELLIHVENGVVINIVRHADIVDRELELVEPRERPQGLPLRRRRGT